MLKRYCLAILIIVNHLSCSTPLRSKQADSLPVADKLNLTRFGDSADKIVFLTFAVSQPDSNKDVYTFSLVQKRYANGEMKRNVFVQGQSIEPFYFYYAISDSSKEEKEQFIKIPNPLTMALEYPDDDGELKKTIVKKKSGHVTVRFQLMPNARYISIYKLNPSSLTLKKIYNASL